MTNYFRALYYLHSMMKRVFWDHKKLREHQDKRLRKIVKSAYENSYFYHEKFRQAEIKPEDVRNIEDLNKLPIVRKEELLENLDSVISKEFNIDYLHVERTSGSTGRPLSVYLTGVETEFRKAKHLRAQMTCGQKPWHKWVTITSPLHFATTTRLQRLLGFYVITPVSVFEDVTTQVSRIETLKPDVLDGYSSSVLLLAEETHKRGLDTIEPKFLVSGAELIDTSSREFIEDVFAAPLYDQYASEEFGRMAWQCPERNEYHIDADSIAMQFIDQDGEEVAPGEEGEIVCTSLFNYAMPFIRYAIGDLGVTSETIACPCGRTFPLMKVIGGRKESIVVLPDGRSLSPLAIGDCMCAYKYFTHVFQYRFIQEKIDFFKILLKKKDSGVKDEVMKVELVEHFRKTLKLSEAEATIEVDFMDEIPPDKTGKIRKVVSELEDNKQCV